MSGFFPILGDQIPQRGTRFSRAGFQLLLRLQGWRFVGEIPNIPKAVAIFAPHTSNLDGWYGFQAMCAVGLRATVLGKHTLMKPPFGGLFRWLGVLPVNRESRLGLTEQVVRYVNSQSQIWIALAPEGTRHCAPQLKTGFYQIAYQTQIPILAFTADYANKTLKFLGCFHPTGDYQADVEILLSWYEGQFSVPHPERLSQPFMQLTQKSTGK